MKDKALRICYFGGYDQDHPRNRVMIAGLEKCGIEVVECHSRHPSRIIRTLQLIVKYWKIKARIDVIIIGASCHAYVPIAWALSRLDRKLLIFDAFVSLFECWEEQSPTNRSVLKGRFAFLLDRLSAVMSDVVLFDTEEHVAYFRGTFGLFHHPVRSIPVGAYCDMPLPTKASDGSSPFKVLFAGSFLPLHGMDVIVKAAELLKEDTEIVIELIGAPEEQIRLKHSHTISPNIVFKNPVPYREYLRMLSQADVALGAFGVTAKAARVIPCKVYDALMAGVPVITAATPAVGRVLHHRLNAILIPPNDPKALAQEILVLKRDPALRRALAVEGQRAFGEIGKPEVVGRKVRLICEEVGVRFVRKGASITSEAKLKP